jgi:hypothetical protein
MCFATLGSLSSKVENSPAMNGNEVRILHSKNTEMQQKPVVENI